MHAAIGSRDVMSRTRDGAIVALVLALLAVSLPARADVAVTPEIVIGGPDQDVPFDAIGGVAVEPASGEFAVAETGRGRVLFFGSDGWLLGRAARATFGLNGETRPGTPSALAFDRQGNLLVADRRLPYVDVLDYTGAPVGRLELPHAGVVSASARGVVAVAVAPDGRILVACGGDSAAIHEYTADYDYLDSWGLPGNEPGQLAGITGIAVAPDSHVVVTCARTRFGIQIFDAKGAFIRGFGVHEPGMGNVSLPGAVAVTQDGRIWVSDEMRHLVQVFDRDGNLLGFIGGMGVAAGEFQYPSALATDGRHRLVVAERGGNRVQVMRIP